MLDGTAFVQLMQDRNAAFLPTALTDTDSLWRGSTPAVAGKRSSTGASAQLPGLATISCGILPASRVLQLSQFTGF